MSQIHMPTTQPTSRGEVVTSEDRALARSAILAGGLLELGDFEFAGAQRANNHLDMEKLFDCPETSQEAVLRPLGALAIRHAPQVLLGIANGGNKYAEALGRRLRLPVARTVKTPSVPGRKTFAYSSEEEERLVLAAERVVVVEDATTRRTSENGAYTSLPGLYVRTVACVTGWDRGLPKEYIRLDIPLVPLIREHIPYELPPEHPLYEFAVEAHS
jgi:orotate phosphoribosyltransferase